jgi:hypothetical protein
MPEELLPEGSAKPIEPAISKAAGILADEAYARLAADFADTPSDQIPVVAGSREQEVACTRLIIEKQRAERQEELRKEIGGIDLSVAHIKKIDAGLSDVVYEVRVFGVREPLNE